ncbi:hypothetical protein HanRHA438_Chr12g0562421 [Helianthus annuus]|nr:hypothetical protein HanOQP8_Chr12g0453931 [Helianthus annuus]KAJ0867374.1 hypothetical protein HanRHA438_Chr12g0562421 [Helianthus annuus]
MPLSRPRLWHVLVSITFIEHIYILQLSMTMKTIYNLLLIFYVCFFLNNLGCSFYM